MTADDNTRTPTTTSKTSKRRFLAGVLAGSIFGGALAAGTGALANEHGWGHHRCTHRGAHGPLDPEAMRERIEFRTDRILSRVDATEEQKTKIKGLVDDAMKDLASMRDAHRANREAMLRSVTGETVDRDGLEAARRAEMDLADRASRRISQTLADAADVLRPEQRKALGELARTFRGHGGHRSAGTGRM
ncbi:MAG: hypothetical protein GC151_09250 [Betaproteobacteria bacterium]|nr:hypothetical protein [Betaproteobacteria bacterium]